MLYSNLTEHVSFSLELRAGEFALDPVPSPFTPFPLNFIIIAVKSNQAEMIKEDSPLSNTSPPLISFPFQVSTAAGFPFLQLHMGKE